MAAGHVKTVTGQMGASTCQQTMFIKNTKRENSSQAHLNSTHGISQPAKVIDQLNPLKKKKMH